jgi:hypothetical protein
MGSVPCRGSMASSFVELHIDFMGDDLKTSRGSVLHDGGATSGGSGLCGVIDPCRRNALRGGSESCYDNAQCGGTKSCRDSDFRASPPAAPKWWPTGTGRVVLGASAGSPKILGPGFHTGGPKTPAQFFFEILYLQNFHHIFYIIEFGAETGKIGIQAEYRPLEHQLYYLLLLGTGAARAGMAGAPMVACL